MPRPGDDFGRYVIVSELGRGGMGIVFKARHRDLDREVALKLLTPVLADDETYRARFLREARILARLDSPHVVRVFDAGEQDNWLFIVTELVPDGDLSELLATGGPLPEAQAIDIADQVAAGLSAAHSVGILHRDIKPSNVLVRHLPGGQMRAVLCDLGIAADQNSDHTKTVGVIGTPSYMAPERHDGTDAAVASDIYSLGCLLWASLTGRELYEGTASQVLLGHLQGPIPQLDGSHPTHAALNALLAGTLAKQPADRIASAEDFRRAVAAIQRYEAPVTERAPGPTSGATQFSVPPPPSARPAAPPMSSAATMRGAPYGHTAGPPQRQPPRLSLVAMLLGVLATLVIAGAVIIAVVVSRDSPAPTSAADTLPPTTESTAPTTPAAPSPTPRRSPTAASTPTEREAAPLRCWNNDTVSAASDCDAVRGAQAMTWVFPDSAGCESVTAKYPRVRSRWCGTPTFTVHYLEWREHSELVDNYTLPSKSLGPATLRADLVALRQVPEGAGDGKYTDDPNTGRVWAYKVTAWYDDDVSPWVVSVYAADAQTARRAFDGLGVRSHTALLARGTAP